MPKTYKFIRFHQFESDAPSDDLMMFAAKAKDLYSWAGIPRKGWNIRMLFQRPITPSREVELKRFWERASSPETGQDFIVGPTAIIIAIQDPEKIKDGVIDLTYERPITLSNTKVEATQILADLLLPRLRKRLSVEQSQVLDERTQNPFAVLPDVGNDYVFEFALQLQQMGNDAEKFFESNDVDDSAKDEIIVAMEAILRPAIVVDG